MIYKRIKKILVYHLNSEKKKDKKIRLKIICSKSSFQINHQIYIIGNSISNNNTNNNINRITNNIKNNLINIQMLILSQKNSYTYKRNNIYKNKYF